MVMMLLFCFVLCCLLICPFQNTQRICLVWLHNKSAQCNLTIVRSFSHLIRDFLEYLLVKGWTNKRHIQKHNQAWLCNVVMFFIPELRGWGAEQALISTHVKLHLISYAWPLTVHNCRASEQQKHFWCGLTGYRYRSFGVL